MKSFAIQLPGDIARDRSNGAKSMPSNAWARQQSLSAHMTSSFSRNGRANGLARIERLFQCRRLGEFHDCGVADRRAPNMLTLHCRQTRGAALFMKSVVDTELKWHTMRRDEADHSARSHCLGHVARGGREWFNRPRRFVMASIARCDFTRTRARLT